MTVTLEAIADPENLMKAAKRVVGNKGAAGVDHMSVHQLMDYMQANVGSLSASLLSGKYRPQPVKRVWIPKDNGKMRGLGVPTVIDRVVQQAITDVLSLEYEPTFSDRSYGFRPKRSTHMALLKAKELANAGYTWTVETDLAKFFDTVPHQRLIGKLSQRIRDGRVISLIHRIMRAEVSDKGELTPTTMGVPQGGPLSPLLANIYLDELDKVLEGRGHQIVRYADDMMVLCKSRRSAQRTLEGIIKYAEKTMKLTVNKEKSGVFKVNYWKVKFLGHGFHLHQKTKEIVLTMHKKARTKLKAEVKEILKRNRSGSIDEVKANLKTLLKGKMDYFRLTRKASWMKDFDGWMRRRIRQLIWKSWKRPATRFRYLGKLGVKGRNQYLAYTRKGYWRTAASPILNAALSDARLERRGWTFLCSSYKQGTLFQM